MDVQVGGTVSVIVTLNERGKPPEYGPVSQTSSRRKVADAELRFTGGVFDGLTLEGFTVWVSRSDPDNYVVAAPTRTLLGLPNSYRKILRPSLGGRQYITGDLKQAIVSAYQQLASRQAYPSEQGRDGDYA